MFKSKFKFLIIFVILIISFTSFSFATNSDDIMLISNDNQSNVTEKEENTRSDLYISDNQYIS